MLTTAGPASSPSHVAADGSITKRMRSDTCFKCKNLGHWARDCPLNTPSPFSKSPPPSSSSSPSPSPLPPSKVGGLPVVRCPCGSGACVIRTSRTAKNPDRKFFACPQASCKLFNGWCDEVSAPVCPCRVGTCSINTDPVSEKKFFACRIKKGHGACGFFQFVDQYDASAKVRSGTVGNAGSVVNTLPRGVLAQATVVNEDPEPTFADFLEASQTRGSVDLISKFDELVGRLSPEQNQSSFDAMTVDNRPSIPSFGSEDSEMEEREPSTDLDETLPVSCQPSSFPNVHLRQKEFLKQLSAAAGDAMTEGQNLLPDVAVKSAFITGLRPQSTGQDPPSVSMTVAKDYAIQNFLGMENGSGNQLAEQCFEKLKQTANDIKCELVQKLDSSDRHDLAQLQWDATVCFALLDHLRVDSQQFKNCIKKFILHASSLTKIKTDESTLNMLERYNEEKRQFDELSRIEGETLNAYAGCRGRIEFLRQEALRLKGMLLHVEKELSDREEESIGLDNNLGDIRHKVEQAKARMEDPAVGAAEASRVLKSMEQEGSAMKAALEEAKEKINM